MNPVKIIPFRKFLFTTFFFLAELLVIAQQPILKNFKTKDGLPSSEVYCAFQDSKGFMWFGTDGGVSRFDGYVFKNFTTEDGLADNVVFGMMEDKHGRIWFRSLTGKLCYWLNDSIYPIEANEVIVQHMKNALITSFYIDKGDTLWCGLRAGKGYFKIAPGYESKDLKLIEVNVGPYIINIEDNHSISGIDFQDKRILTPFISIYSKEKFERRVDIPGLNTVHLFYTKPVKDSFLVADYNNLFYIQKQQPYALLNKDYFSEKQIISLKESENYIWVGLLRNGVYKFVHSPQSGLVKKEIILNDYSVTDVLTDNEGGTWFTTLESGIFYASPARFVSYPQLNQKNPYTNINIKKIGASHILISTEKDFINLISPDSISTRWAIKGNAFRNFLRINRIPTTLIVTGNLQINNSSQSYLWDNATLELRELKNSQDLNSLIYFFSVDTVKQINYLFDRYWVMTHSPKDKFVKFLLPLPSRTFSFFKDKKGVIWLGCLNGLWSFEKEKFIFHGNENPLLKSTIEDIKEDADGTRYYATRGNGVIIYKNGIYTKITTHNGLNSNNCKCLLVDESKNIWVGSKNGICKIKNTGSGWQVLKFNLTDNDFNYEVFGIEKIKNKLWLFTDRGPLSYELGTSETEFPPKMYITQFSVNELSHLKDSLRIFEANQNYVKFSFVGLSYQSLGKLFYSYKLEGLDTMWHSTSATSLQYPFLPPGHYTFKVKAISFGGANSVSVCSLEFTIKKPIWKTTWFILLAVILLFGIVYLAFYIRLKSIQKKEEEKTQLNKKISEMEIKALRSQMNPHFIFNAINSIQNYIVKNDSRTAQDYLAKFARLIRNVLENSKQENISLSKELETLKLYIELEQLRTPGKFTFTLQIQEGLNCDTLDIPPLIIQPYVENAILHGLMPLTERDGLLIIKISKTGNKLLCIIDDNGIGRKKAGELKHEKQLMHKSMGISVTEDRIKVKNNLTGGISGITIEDKLDTNGNGIGTNVIITIYLDK